jgi:DNA polymerase (family 10)|tara:strand:- start:321 stop:836 length:516 start_codon:yes stop_codon:yes gene_type:complete
MSKGEPIPSDDALRIAKKHMIGLACLDTTEKIAIVGSLRRKSEFVKDIDYQIIGNPYAVEEYFYNKDWECKSGGNKRYIFKAPSGIYVNCFFTKPECWGAALMHNTGPSRYNIRKRMMIKRKGGILNQYGLYMPPEGYEDDEVGLEHMAGRTEQEIYDALDWTYCEPEDRE